jgi:hypothetical protein
MEQCGDSAAMTREQRLKYERRYRAANRKRIAEYQCAYRAANRERLAEYHHHYRHDIYQAANQAQDKTF